MEASAKPVNLLNIFFVWVIGLFSLSLGANLFGSGYWLGLLPLILAGVLFVIGGRWTRIALTTRTPFPSYAQEDPLPGGVELGAEVLGRYEGGALAGSEDAKRRYARDDGAEDQDPARTA